MFSKDEVNKEVPSNVFPKDDGIIVISSSDDEVVPIVEPPKNSRRHRMNDIKITVNKRNRPSYVGNAGSKSFLPDVHYVDDVPDDQENGVDPDIERGYDDDDGDGDALWHEIPSYLMKKMEAAEDMKYRPPTYKLVVDVDGAPTQADYESYTESLMDKTLSNKTSYEKKSNVDEKSLVGSSSKSSAAEYVVKPTVDEKSSVESSKLYGGDGDGLWHEIPDYIMKQMEEFEDMKRRPPPYEIFEDFDGGPTQADYDSYIEGLMDTPPSAKSGYEKKLKVDEKKLIEVPSNSSAGEYVVKPTPDEKISVGSSKLSGVYEPRRLRMCASNAISPRKLKYEDEDDNAAMEKYYYKYIERNND